MQRCKNKLKDRKFVKLKKGRGLSIYSDCQYHKNANRLKRPLYIGYTGLSRYST